jgi:hypothetical protein
VTTAAKRQRITRVGDYRSDGTRLVQVRSVTAWMVIVEEGSVEDPMISKYPHEMFDEQFPYRIKPSATPA